MCLISAELVLKKLRGDSSPGPLPLWRAPGIERTLGAGASETDAPPSGESPSDESPSDASTRTAS
ncbi:hypothetical protein [Litorihabitans aurantiacus]